MKKITAGLMTIALTLMVGCSKKEGIITDTSKPIIKVNDAVITQNMYDKAFQINYNTSFLAQKNIDLKNPQNKMIALIYKDKTVNELIIRELINQEAQKRNITVKSDEVDKFIDQIAQKLGGKEKLETELTLKNIDKNVFLSNVKADLITKKLIENLSVGLNTTDKEAQDFYNKNKSSKFQYPDLVRAQHILISASVPEIKGRIEAENSKLTQAKLEQMILTELNKAKVKAEKVLAEANANPANFGELAKKYSDDPASAQRGGDLGFFSKKEMVPQFTQAAFSTAPGKISNLVRTDFGYHIIKVSDRKKAGITPFVEVKDEIKQFLSDQKKLSTLQKLIDSSKNTAKITFIDAQYNPKNIEKEIKDISKNRQASTPGSDLKVKK